MSKNVVIVGAGVAGVNAATKLIDNNFDGKITIIDIRKGDHIFITEQRIHRILKGTTNLKIKIKLK